MRDAGKLGVFPGFSPECAFKTAPSASFPSILGSVRGTSASFPSIWGQDSPRFILVHSPESCPKC